MGCNVLKTLHVDDLSIDHTRTLKRFTINSINAKELHVKDLYFTRQEVTTDPTRPKRETTDEMQMYLSNNMDTFVVTDIEGPNCTYLIGCFNKRENRVCTVMKSLNNIFLLNYIDPGTLTKDDVRHLYANVMMGPMLHYLIYRSPIEIREDVGSFKNCIDIGGGVRRMFYGQNEINIGSGDSVTHFNAIKIGTALHTGANSLSIGFNNAASVHALALGRNCKALQARDTCVGFDTRGALAIGRSVMCEDDIAVGLNINLTGGNNITIGTGHVLPSSSCITMGEDDADQRSLYVDQLIGHDRIKGDRLVLRFREANGVWIVNKVLMFTGAKLESVEDVPVEGPVGAGNKPFRVGNTVLHGHRRIVIDHFIGGEGQLNPVALLMALPRVETTTEYIHRDANLYKVVILSSSTSPLYVYYKGELHDLKTGVILEPEIDGTYLVDNYTFIFDQECNVSISSDRFLDNCRQELHYACHYVFDFNDPDNADILPLMRAPENAMPTFTRRNGIVIAAPDARNYLDKTIEDATIIGSGHRFGSFRHSLVVGSKIRKNNPTALYIGIGADIDTPETSPEGGINICSSSARNLNSMCLGTAIDDNVQTIAVGNTIARSNNCVSIGKILNDNTDSVHIAAMRGAFTRPEASNSAVNIGCDTLGAINNTVSLGKPVTAGVRQKSETPFVMLNNITEVDLKPFFDVEQDEMSVFVDVYEETSYQGRSDSGNVDVGSYYYYPRLDTHTLLFDTEEYLKLNLNGRDVYVPLIARK